MTRKPGVTLWIVSVMLFVSSLACATIEPMGELAVGGDPVEFQAHDETEHVWTARVEPGNEYVVSIAHDELDEQYFQGSIWIYDEGTNTLEASGLIAEASNSSSVPFIAPDDGDVSIIIFVVNWVGADLKVVLREGND